jgi:hypothetical protein
VAKLAPVAAFVLLATSAFGASISTSGVWVNPLGGSNLNGVGTNQLAWGTTTGAQSSWRFDGVAGVLIDLGAIENEFSLGTFTHFNFPVRGTFITGATVNITLDILNGNLFGSLFSFDFTHLETPNTPPCDPPGSPPCPDVVGIPVATSSQTIDINGKDFFLEILGFKNNINDPNITQFITNENQANATQLFGRLREVPEPGMYVLVGVGLMGLAVLRRRRGPSGQFRR